MSGLLRRHTVLAMMELGKVSAEFANYSLLFLFACAFLLRLPSEALPTTALRGDNCLGSEGIYCMCCGGVAAWTCGQYR